MNERKWIAGVQEIRMHNTFVIFLDVDGVLNTMTTVKKAPSGYIGIDDSRVELLEQVIRKCGGADIVLSSDWKDLKPDHEDYKYLVSKLSGHNLKISGKTRDEKHNRGNGIKKYLKEHSEIEEYVILDDNRFDFQDCEKIWERLLLTNGIESARIASDTPAIETILFYDYIQFTSRQWRTGKSQPGFRTQKKLDFVLLLDD